MKYIAIAMLLLFGFALLWIFSGENRGSGGLAALLGARHETGTSLPLDVRFRYDPKVLKPGAYDDRAEFPFLMEGQGLRFCGKRLRGAGTMLEKAPGPLLYDFVGSVHNEMFAQWYAMEQLGNPLFEDAKIQRRLALHHQAEYRATERTRQWPSFAPPEAQAGGTLYSEGWTLFTEQDLYFFYAFSAAPLTREQRNACLRVLESMEFGAVLGGKEWERDPYEAVEGQLREEDKAKQDGEGDRQHNEGEAQPDGKDVGDEKDDGVGEGAGE